MSEKIGAADTSYDTAAGYKPKPSCNFFEEAIKALLKCLGAEAPSNIDTPTEQVDDEPPATSAETEDGAAPTVPQTEGAVTAVNRPGPTPPPGTGGN